ncbi:flavodoxin domain-containing protein, partial [Crossiella equi]
ADPVSAGGYSAYVLGSAVHDQAWLESARRFVAVHEAALAARPLWLFSIGMPGTLRPPLNRWARREERHLVGSFRDRVHARDHRLFTGVVVPAQLNRLGRLLFRLAGGRYGDFRDWQAIEAWADGIAEALDQEVTR